MRVKMLVFPLAVSLVIGFVLFAASGRIDLPEFWAFIGIWTIVGCLVVLTTDEDLMRERRNPAGASRDNLPLLRMLGFFSVLGYLTLAGLDRRYGWAGTVQPAIQAVGFAGMIAAIFTMVWAMRTNRFFSSAVRIQSDRGHEVVTGGPYGLVRHPGYTAFILVMLAGALGLGSWLALIPALAWTALFVRRAAIEDRMLRDELKGYKEYARAVRFRLLPHVW